MRVHGWSLTLMGCVGGADLGHVPVRGDADADVVVASTDAGAAQASDAALLLAAQITTTTPSDACGTCYDLVAQRVGAPATTSYRWDDGSTSSSRRVCPTSSQTVTVTLADVATGETAVTSAQLAPRASTCSDAGTQDPAVLCLQNGTFAVDALHLPSLPTTFAAAPWIACSSSNPIPPTLYDDSSMLPVSTLHATDGPSFVGFLVSQQLSQQPCASLPVGDARRFTLDLAAAPTTDNVSDSFSAALEVWGGSLLTCSQDEKLWTSPVLTASWKSFCATITPQHETDLLTLRAVSTGMLPFPGRVLVDNIKPVAACP